MNPDGRLNACIYFHCPLKSNCNTRYIEKNKPLKNAGNKKRPLADIIFWQMSRDRTSEIILAKRGWKIPGERESES